MASCSIISIQRPGGMQLQAYGFRDRQYFKRRRYNLHNSRCAFAGWTKEIGGVSGYPTDFLVQTDRSFATAANSSIRYIYLLWELLAKGTSACGAISINGRNLVSQRTRFLVTTRNKKKKSFIPFQIIGSKQTIFSFFQRLIWYIYYQFSIQFNCIAFCLISLHCYPNDGTPWTVNHLNTLVQRRTTNTTNYNGCKRL